MVSILVSGPSCPRFEVQCYRNFSEKKIADFSVVNQQLYLEESEKWLENLG